MTNPNNVPTYTENEQQYCAQIAGRIDRLRHFLQGNALGDIADGLELFTFLSSLKEIQGNFNNDLSFTSILLAKKYLTGKFGITFDAAEKPQGAPGIDIDLMLPNGERIVAEVKTTVPYHPNDFGATQAASFRKDFAKLRCSPAACKFLFVTADASFSVLKKDKYTRQMPGVRIVLLTTGKESQVPG